MKIIIAATGMMLATCSISCAESVTAQCSLDIDGKSAWKGKCCVETTATDDGSTGFLVTVHAESWRGCVYEKQHPGLNASLPTYQQKCFGPWISIFEEKDDAGTGKTLSAYWSIEDACHGGKNVVAIKTGEGTYHGDNFRFTWKPTY
jgi:hypothetical protein